MAGGKLGAETYFMASPGFDQFLPFSDENWKHYYAFTFNTSSRKWTIVEINGEGLSRVTDSGELEKSYTHVVMRINGTSVLFGLDQSDNSWFLQPINTGGKLGIESQHGSWKSPYATLSSYSRGVYTFLFGQDTRPGGSMDMFLNQVDVYNVANTKTPEMGRVTDTATWIHSYKPVVFYRECMKETA